MKNTGSAKSMGAKTVIKDKEKTPSRKDVALDKVKAGAPASKAAPKKKK